MILAIVNESLPAVIVLAVVPIVLAILAGFFGYDLEMGRMKFKKSKTKRDK